jgi:hypothetical protein
MICYLNYKQKKALGSVEKPGEKIPWKDLVGLAAICALIAPLLIAFLIVGSYLAVPIMCLALTYGIFYSFGELRQDWRKKR